LEKNKFQEISPQHRDLYVAETAAAKAYQLAFNDLSMIRQLANRHLATGTVVAVIVADGRR
jgi:hypothetical protein